MSQQQQNQITNEESIFVSEHVRMRDMRTPF